MDPANLPYSAMRLKPFANRFVNPSYQHARHAYAVVAGDALTRQREDAKSAGLIAISGSRELQPDEKTED